MNETILALQEKLPPVIEWSSDSALEEIYSSEYWNDRSYFNGNGAVILIGENYITPYAICKKHSL